MLRNEQPVADTHITRHSHFGNVEAFDLCLRLGTKADQGETLQTIDMLYDREVIIEERPSFLGIERWRPRITPQDWLHPSPRVTIFLKTPPVPPPSPAFDSEAGL